MKTILLVNMPGEWELLIIMIVLGIPGIIWLIALIDCLKSEFKGNQKLIWILVIILIPFLGSLLYLIMGRSDKAK